MCLATGDLLLATLTATIANMPYAPNHGEVIETVLLTLCTEVTQLGAMYK